MENHQLDAMTAKALAYWEVLRGTRGKLNIARRQRDEAIALCHEATAERDALKGEVERLREFEAFHLSDGGRLLRKSDIADVCDTPGLCLEHADDVGRCGPCAIKIAMQADIKAMRTRECVPQVLKLTREINSLISDHDALKAEVERLREALTLAANRLRSCAIDYDSGSRKFIETGEWADEASAALRAEQKGDAA